ncbi:hypothetical protein C1701_15600 [Actinoalloteichus sp. AHMU CJ021]|uniref:MAB_1171c family putative transporter n=1 Tax=Actinoalloteichus sp. AHMU CJ021 TaxID=2072503 RepID=UPI000CA08C63|nr:hypothetical protein C1701_15600 [Actinoalloteichus sp. AHMU CJ021]
MLNRDLVQSIVLGLIVAGCVIKLFHLRRSGENRPAIVGMCLGLMGLAVGLLLLDEAAGVIGSAELDEAVGPGVAYALRQIPIMIAAYGFRLFLIAWVWEPGRQRTLRMWLQTAIAGTVILARLLIGVVTPSGEIPAVWRSDWGQVPWSAAGMLLYAAYMGSTAIAVTRLTWLWARDAQTRRTTKIGLWLICAMAICGGIEALHKIGYFTAVAVVGHKPPYDQYAAEFVPIALGTACGAIGLALPLIANGVPAAIRTYRHRAARRGLWPLWSALTALRPGVVIPQHPRWLPTSWTRAWESVDLRKLDVKLYHRVIECWDVLVYLHGHLSSEVREREIQRAVAEGHGPERARSLGEAEMIRQAVDRARERRPFLAESERARPLAAHRTLAENVRWLRQVAAAWRRGATGRTR